MVVENRAGAGGNVAKPQPYASAGNGTPQHLVTEFFAKTVGVKLEHVPYKGAGPGMSDIIGGQVPN